MPGIYLRRARSSSDGAEGLASQFTRCFVFNSLTVVLVPFSMWDAKVRVKGEIKPVQPSFYDDIIRLPDIIEKVLSSEISNTLHPPGGSCARENCAYSGRSPVLSWILEVLQELVEVQ